jgi:hypothetical protein
MIHRSVECKPLDDGTSGAIMILAGYLDTDDFESRHDDERPGPPGRRHRSLSECATGSPGRAGPGPNSGSVVNSTALAACETFFSFSIQVTRKCHKPDLSPAVKPDEMLKLNRSTVLEDPINLKLIDFQQT